MNDPTQQRPSEAAVPPGIWERIKEHKILQWGLGYLGAAIAIAHGQELMAEAFEWPHLIGRILVSVLILGTPLMIALAWYHGHKGLKHIGSGEFAILSVLILIAAGLLVVFVRSPGERTEPRSEPVARQVSPRPSLTGAVVAPGVTLAVLPFADMSPGHDQEYFSDGLSEEVLNQLAQIKDLRVSGRTSSFSFKGKNEDLRIIATKLGVGNLLEGSVRKDGARLRITVQLIDGRDGSHLWSQTYDRELKGVFSLQEQIAKDVAKALSIRLDVGDMSRAQGGTINLDAYDAFLKAEALVQQDGSQQAKQAIELYRDALAVDPAFARAWVGVYRAQAMIEVLDPKLSVTARKEMAHAITRLEVLAPNAWWAQYAFADQLIGQHNWVQARAAIDAADASAPPNSEPYIVFDAAIGSFEATIPRLERMRRSDPLSLGRSGTLQLLLDIAGRPREAQAEYERSRHLEGDHGQWDFFAVLRLWRNKGASRTAIRNQIAELLKSSSVPLAGPLDRVLSNSEDAKAALAAVHQAFVYPAYQNATYMLIIALDADHYGDKDLALVALRRSMVELRLHSLELLWFPYETGLRTDSRFKDLLRDLGLAEYFRASGNWGDFCHPLGTADFECH
jgi:TolB-like protein